MAIKLAIPASATMQGFPAPEAYLRITGTTIDWKQKTMMFSADVWLNADTRLANKQPLSLLNPIPSIYIQATETPARTEPKRNALGNIELNADGTQKTIETYPALPSFDQVEQQLGEAIASQSDYRIVGYNLFKSLGIVKEYNPVDVI